jgi:hypothetical protein
MKKLAIIALLMSLSACSQSVTKECKVGIGADCKSVSEVNEMINRKELPRRGKVEESVVQSKLDINTKVNPEQSGVSRVREQTARIWMNGFEDEQGDYIEESYVHVVLKGGQWRYAK